MAGKGVGLTKRGGVWWLEKLIDGRRVRESTGTGDLAEAKRYLAFRLNEIRRVTIYGERPLRSFEQAAARYLRENADKRSLDRDDQALRLAMPHLGHQELGDIHYGKLQTFADARLANGVSKSTVNRDMAAVKQVLKAAARWFHENGQPWLTAVPEVPRYKLRCTATEERAITWDEQRRLSQALPAYLATMTLFAVNTGARRGEVLELRWGWEVQNHSAFLIPPQFHKTGASIGSRLLVCNSVAWAVIEEARGRHAEFVFTHHSKPVRTFYGRAWKQARSHAGLSRVRVHDLRHTFATRLEAAGVSRSDVAEMLGHATSSVTRRYIAPDISRLLHEAEKVVAMRHEPVLRIVG